jgi:hypothetical protein
LRYYMGDFAAFGSSLFANRVSLKSTAKPNRVNEAARPVVCVPRTGATITGLREESMSSAEGGEQWTDPQLGAQLMALTGVAPRPVVHVVFRSTQRADGELTEGFEIAGEAPLPGADALDAWVARRLPGADRLAISVLVIRETLDARGMIVQCLLERRRGAPDGPLHGDPARVDFTGAAGSVRLFRSHPDGRLTEIAPAADSTPLRPRPPEQFAGEHKALQARFGAGIHILDSREPTLFEDMIGLSTVVHLRAGDGREVSCGIGWHGNVPFVLDADFPCFAGPQELSPEDEALLSTALRHDDLVRGETRFDEFGIAIMARRRASDALFLLRPGSGAIRVEPYSPGRSAAGPDQQRWMNFAESYEGLAVLDAWHDGTTDDVMVLTGDLSGQIWRHHIDLDGVESWRKTDDEAAIGAVHRERLFPGSLAPADSERDDTDQAAASQESFAAEDSLLARVEAYVCAVASLRIAVANADTAPDVAVSYVRVLHAALETLGAHVAAAMTWPLIGRPDTAALGRIEEPLRQELAATRCIVVPLPRAGLVEPDEAPFGLEVAADFQSTGYDIEEASTCLALRRPTASVFHCMRVLESGISICARRAKVVDPLTAPERDWQTILRLLQGGADTGAAAALMALNTVRRRWRTARLVLADRYTEEGAEQIFQAVCRFMRALR